MRKSTGKPKKVASKPKKTVSKPKPKTKAKPKSKVQRPNGLGGDLDQRQRNRAAKGAIAQAGTKGKSKRKAPRKAY